MNRRDEVVATLARERWGALVGYAYLLTGSVGDAEDLVQDALVKVVVRGRDGTDVQAVEAYVRQAVMSTFLDGYRRRVRWARVRTLVAAEGRDRTGRDPALATANQVDVRAALAGLSPRERACVVLRHMDDLSVAETAERLGVSVGAVKRYTSDGMTRLEGVLGPIADPHPNASAGTSTTTVERTVTR
ncbi:sigma-70 family RNA polymerase sigma factor [Cellulomonas sp. KRMCY2]|uniref:sigma-70 family RNA polymerase sigma factor n=1 Tax=Cellulomonas sp. KRMCY2 TaxID=1304865 RepID=UPI00045EC65E|nr:sigma-70 family RNA polymerase sigma factor [Cellulomonas sp. KRMCY2]